MAYEILSRTSTMTTMTTTSPAVAACAGAGASSGGTGGRSGGCGVLNGSFSTRKSLTFPSTSPGLGRFNLSNDCKLGRVDLIRQRAAANGAIATTSAACEAQDCLGALASTESSYSSQSNSENDANVLESWLETSLDDIVRHLSEAPFLHYVKSNRVDGGGVWQRVSEELFDKPENWGPVKQSLSETSSEGIILVHRLNQESVGDCLMTMGCKDSEKCGEHLPASSSLQPGGFSTDVWGVLVSGCRGRCNACYILKTTRVASSSGVLTHFCVFGAKCFGPSLKEQLQSTWLL